MADRIDGLLLFGNGGFPVLPVVRNLHRVQRQHMNNNNTIVGDARRCSCTPRARRCSDSPPIDLNCAPVRQWEAWEWEDQLGSDPSGFVTSGKPFWKSSLLCSSKPPKGYLQTFAYRFIYIFAQFLTKREIARGIGSSCDWVTVRRGAAGSLRIFHDSNLRIFLRMDCALRE